ncbi:hypothetical protein UCMB321_4557 [Pseudomonas batumici]|uniref:Uncharacterized protein n=1 Tax=Pseudomonas batumici TaxID=226910 RepID=A0A0C2E7L6_9PSED|nr:hypothetical protein UCMB321_4557 [Pseudomonas batumici]
MGCVDVADYVSGLVHHGTLQECYRSVMLNWPQNAFLPTNSSNQTDLWNRTC